MSFPLVRGILTRVEAPRGRPGREVKIEKKWLLTPIKKQNCFKKALDTQTITIDGSRSSTVNGAGEKERRKGRRGGEIGSLSFPSSSPDLCVFGIPERV